MKCAILSYDSGESSFQMTMNPAPDMEIHTVGGSHYKGDIYLDLYSHWIQKAIMDEIVVSETRLPFPPNKINTVTERHTILRNVGEKEYEQD
jgi:hypothetical protein